MEWHSCTPKAKTKTARCCRSLSSRVTWSLTSRAIPGSKTSLRAPNSSAAQGSPPFPKESFPAQGGVAPSPPPPGQQQTALRIPPAPPSLSVSSSSATCFSTYNHGLCSANSPGNDVVMSSAAAMPNQSDNGQSSLRRHQGVVPCGFKEPAAAGVLVGAGLRCHNYLTLRSHQPCPTSLPASPEASQTQPEATSSFCPKLPVISRRPLEEQGSQCGYMALPSRGACSLFRDLQTKGKEPNSEKWWLTQTIMLVASHADLPIKSQEISTCHTLS